MLGSSGVGAGTAIAALRGGLPDMSARFSTGSGRHLGRLLILVFAGCGEFDSEEGLDAGV